MNIRKIHYRSGIIIAVFVFFHLLNHLFSLAGPERHIAVMDTFRIIYRNIFIESIILIAVVLQIISGIKLFRTLRNTSASGFEKLHLLTGLYLAFFFVLHVSAVISGRLLLHLDTNFYFGVAGLNTFPFNLFFIPYYSLAVFSFFGHIASIHNRKMKYSLAGISPDNQSKILLAAGIIVTVAILVGSTNYFSGVDIPEAYNVLILK